MEKEVLQVLHARKSVRAFENRAVPAEVKDAILKAAMQAPTAGCQQLYTILDITDPARKAALAKSCDDQPFIAAAPVVLIFCADAQRWYDLFAETGCAPRQPGAGDLMLAVLDAAIAAQNAVVAAEALGLGSCYIGDILERCEEHRAMLELPPYVMPAAMLVLGYPAPSQLRRAKPRRCAPADLVCENVYVRKSGAALREMYAFENENLDEWAQKFCARKYQAAFSREMTRSVEEYLRTFRTGLQFPDDAL